MCVKRQKHNTANNSLFLMSRALSFESWSYEIDLASLAEWQKGDDFTSIQLEFSSLRILFLEQSNIKMTELIILDSIVYQYWSLLLDSILLDQHIYWCLDLSVISVIFVVFVIFFMFVVFVVLVVLVVFVIFVMLCDHITNMIQDFVLIPGSIHKVRGKELLQCIRLLYVTIICTQSTWIRWLGFWLVYNPWM